jgi:hypothetical protein
MNKICFKFKKAGPVNRNSRRSPAKKNSDKPPRHLTSRQPLAGKKYGLAAVHHSS